MGTKARAAENGNLVDLRRLSVGREVAGSNHDHRITIMAWDSSHESAQPACLELQPEGAAEYAQLGLKIVNNVS